MENENKNFHRQWFKFYGQDWLTDTKIIRMKIEDRLCFITLLCLASSAEEQGVIKNCTEESIIALTQLYEDVYNDDNEVSRAKGCFERFEALGMITNDNNDNVIINNFLKRQTSNLTGYERVKRFREKQKELQNKPKNKGKISDNTVNVINDNGRGEKKREEKKREDIQSNALFEEFWKLYPKKVEKLKAEQKWCKLPLEVQNLILKDVPLRSKGLKWSKNDGQFIENPLTYLNGERWNDVIEQPKELPAFNVVKI
jgi:hypothetical protein